MNTKEILRIAIPAAIIIGTVAFDQWLRYKERKKGKLQKETRIHEAQDRWNAATVALGEWRRANKFASASHPVHVELLEADFHAYHRYLREKGPIGAVEMAELERMKRELEKARAI